MNYKLNEFYNIVIYGDFTKDEIEEILIRYKKIGKLIYIISSVIKISILDSNIIIFSTILDFYSYFYKNKNTYLPYNIISNSLDKKKEINKILLKIHKIRLTKEGRSYKNVLLTIAIPSFNRGHRALRLVNSLLDLNYDAEIEFVISNNGSYKNTEGYKVIKSINDARISYYEFKNPKSVSMNILNVIKKSKGSFVLLISDEDKVNNFNLLYYLNKIQKNNKIAVVLSNIWGILNNPNPYYSKNEYISSNNAILNILSRSLNSYISGGIYNRKLIRKYKLDKWMLSKEYQKNKLWLDYPHKVLSLTLLKYGCLNIDTKILILKGKAEKFHEVKYDFESKLPEFATYKSRINHFQALYKILKEMNFVNYNQLKNIYICICQTMLLDLIYNSFMCGSYKVTTICSVYKIASDECLNGMYALFPNINSIERNILKIKIVFTKNYYIIKTFCKIR